MESIKGPFFNKKGQRLLRIAEKYVVTADIRTLGYIKKEKTYYATFKNPHLVKKFKTPSELKKICESEKRKRWKL